MINRNVVRCGGQVGNRASSAHSEVFSIPLSWWRIEKKNVECGEETIREADFSDFIYSLKNKNLFELACFFVFFLFFFAYQTQGLHVDSKAVQTQRKEEKHRGGKERGYGVHCAWMA